MTTRSSDDSNLNVTSHTHHHNTSHRNNGDETTAEGFTFPALRSEEWLNLNFSTVSDTMPKEVLQGIELSPKVLQKHVGVGIWEPKFKEVQNDIRKILFRQALFKIQNVEVTTLSRCQELRSIHSVTTIPQRTTRNGTPTNSDGNIPNTCLVGHLIRVHRWFRRPKDSIPIREEEWIIGRCGKPIPYRVEFFREGEDGFSVDVRPQRLGDLLCSARQFTDKLYRRFGAQQT